MLTSLETVNSRWKVCNANLMRIFARFLPHSRPNPVSNDVTHCLPQTPSKDSLVHIHHDQIRNIMGPKVAALDGRAGIVSHGVDCADSIQCKRQNIPIQNHWSFYNSHFPLFPLSAERCSVSRQTFPSYSFISPHCISNYL